MALLTEQARIPTKARLAFMPLLCCLMMPSLSTAYAIVTIAPWRPAKVPKLLMEPNEPKAWKLSQKLTYSESDLGYICKIAFYLDPNDGTAFLRRYIAEYSKRNELTDPTWGRAVFCLGLVQTEQAKQELLRLWNLHDELLASGKSKVEFSNLAKSVSPLEVIGDAIHFYLWDDEIREWFIRRIREAEKLPKPSNLDLAKSSRRAGRLQLLSHFYRWDIIESVDGERIITPDKVSRFYPFTSHKVKNVCKAADGVVSHVKTLQLVEPDITKKQWLKIRSSPREYSFDEVTMLLGRPLALAIWEEYLKEESSARLEDINHRLWLTTLWTYLHSFIRMHNSSWVPEQKDNFFLRDATAYVAQLPDGHIRKLAAGALFKMSRYAPEHIENQQIEEIRELSKELLSKDYRKGIILNVEMNKRPMKRSK